MTSNRGQTYKADLHKIIEDANNYIRELEAELVDRNQLIEGLTAISERRRQDILRIQNLLEECRADQGFHRGF